MYPAFDGMSFKVIAISLFVETATSLVPTHRLHPTHASHFWGKNLELSVHDRDWKVQRGGAEVAHFSVDDCGRFSVTIFDEMAVDDERRALCERSAQFFGATGVDFEPLAPVAAFCQQSWGSTLTPKGASAKLLLDAATVRGWTSLVRPISLHTDESPPNGEEV